MRHLLLPCLCAIVLAACGESASPPPSTPMKPEDTVFGDQLKTMDRARAVEGTLQQEKERADAAIDEATGP